MAADVPARLLALYLRNQEIEAEALERDDPACLDRGWLRRDMGYVRLTGRNVSLMTLRPAGGWSVSLPPFYAKKVQHLDLHHVVARDPWPEPVAFEAELKMKVRHGQVREAVWVGGRVAARLSSDEANTRRLRELLDPDHRLRVLPDTAHKCVRIVHRTGIKASFSLPAVLGGDEGLAFDHGMPSRELLDAIDEVAACVLRTAPAQRGGGAG